MSGFRIDNGGMGAPAFPKSKPKKEASYLAFLHQLPCVVSGAYGVQAAHVSFANTALGHYGRGKGTKVPDRWALPLSPAEHAKQHAMNEREYWRQAEINPHLMALAIWGLWTELGDSCEAFAFDVIASWECLPW